MGSQGTHTSRVSSVEYGATFPSDPVNGQEFYDNVNNLHCIYDSAAGKWWCSNFTTSTSTSTSSSTSTTTSTSSSTTTTSTSTTTTSTSTSV